MIILAENPNDKGSQLESLTLRLLRHHNYRNCVTNVMANGAEIDVRGELELAGLGSSRTQHLICECKAHKSVIDMTQWCKFLGKVFHHEVCTQSEVAGCFISLSGVNGYVNGNFEELKRHRKSISLLHGDDLLLAVREIIPFISLKEINQRVVSMTPRTVSRFIPAYCDEKLFWVIVFSDGEFTLFDAKGRPISDEEAVKLARLTKSELDVSSYVDIQAESLAQARNRKSRSLVIANLFLSEGSVTSFEDATTFDDLSHDELENSAQQLLAEGIVQQIDGRYAIPICSTLEGDLIALEIYRVLLGSGVLIQVLRSNYYRSHINRAFLSEILTIQGGIPIEENKCEEIVELLKLSPSALSIALSPIQLLVASRKQEDANQRLNKFHQDYFRQQLQEGIKHDFRNPALAEFYFEFIGLRELETTTVLALKKQSVLHLRAEFNERTGIGRTDESLGGGLVYIAMLPDAPEPWEIPQFVSSNKKE